MARRVSRPLALRVTWVIAPTGISAHAITCLAILCALAAAAGFASGCFAGWLSGAVLLQLWYLFDHVDGQIARLRGTSSLDGIQLDYLMHHLVNLVVPYSLGYGLWKATASEHWSWFGLAFAVGLLLLGLANDTRYKAFIARLEQLNGMPLAVRPNACGAVVGNVGRAGRVSVPVGFDVKTIAAGLRRFDSQAPPGGLRLPLAWAWYDRFCSSTLIGSLPRHCVHVARKLCEIHVVMNAITMITVVQYFVATARPMQLYVTVMGPLALFTAVATLARDIRRGAAEQEFARWYRAGVDDGVSPNQGGQQRAQPEVIAAGDFVTAGDA